MTLPARSIAGWVRALVLSVALAAVTLLATGMPVTAGGPACGPGATTTGPAVFACSVAEPGRAANGAREWPANLELGKAATMRSQVVVYGYDEPDDIANSPTREPAKSLARLASQEDGVDPAAKISRHIYDAASALVAPNAGSVNAVGGSHNCTSCVIAGDSTLAGNPASAIDLYPGRAIPGGNAAVADYAGAPWRSVSGRSAIEQELLAAGDGARGIVYGTDGVDAHVWNAVVQDGRVNFVDFQGIGPSGPAAFDAWDTFGFVRTN